MSFIDNLRKKRQKLADVLIDDEYSGIRQIVEDLYPDRAHFIYELLQNAEDTGATKVSFALHQDALVFEHNGRPFDEKDVEAITNIGKGTKSDQENKIGRFGVGFKAVFAYSETPRIWSPTYSFQIAELVLPFEISPEPGLGQKTRFEFPFNNPKKAREVAYQEVAAGLDELAETTLLFLCNIEAIEWKVGGDFPSEIHRKKHPDNHIEIYKKTRKEEPTSLHFLRFSAPVEIDGKPDQSVSVAYTLGFLPHVSYFDLNKPLAEQMKIVPANPGCVAIFFPAEKETSGLRFHLHGPFVPELSRASIKETPANQPLFRQLENLAADSLAHIRDLGLLTGDFLGVLPNPLDILPGRYLSIRTAIIAAMNNRRLTPTYSKSHAPAKYLLQAKTALKELISEQDLIYLPSFEGEAPKWSITASQRNSNQDRFLAGLQIKTWDVQQFFELLKKKASEKEKHWEIGPEEKFMLWLSQKSLEWHQQMYALLYNDLIALSPYDQKSRLKDLCRLKIVRLSDGTYSTGDKSYFPGESVDHDEILPRVNRMVYESGKKKAELENAKEFLVQIGVREVGEVEEVEGILKTRYIRSKFEPQIKDLPGFIKLVDKYPDQAKIFSDHFIFKRMDEKWGIPSIVFLDQPFQETGLSAYYNNLDDENTPMALSDEYLNCGIENEKLVKFAIAVGVIHKLPVSESRCYKNPESEKLFSGPGSQGYTIDEDYTIADLDKLFESPSVELSRLVWRTMNSLDPMYLRATYQKSRKRGPQYADSQLVHLLRSQSWVPQKDGSFVQPCDAFRDRLPKGFPFDDGQEWLTKVEFGKTAKKQSEDYKTSDQIVQKIGFASLDDAYLWLEVAKAAKQQGKKPADFLLKLKTVSNNKTPNFPVRPVANPERRENRLSGQLLDAAHKGYVQRDRSIRTTRLTIDPVLWLRNQYTNEGDQLICQICKEEMPFRKRNGEYYFEAIEMFSNVHFALEHEAQYLALCPLCAARYKEFVKSSENDMETLKNELMNSKNLEVPLHLGDLNTSIQFVETHWLDIKTIIQQK